MNPDLCHRIVFPTELNSLCIYYTHQLLLFYNMSIWAEYSRRILVCWLKIMKVWCDGWGPTLPIQAIKTQNTNHLGLQKLGFFWRTLRFRENIVCVHCSWSRHQHSIPIVLRIRSCQIINFFLDRIRYQKIIEWEAGFFKTQSNPDHLTKKLTTCVGVSWSSQFLRTSC